jgi:hypothetical protein
MTLTRLDGLQVALTFTIVLLIIVILYPAWTVASARFTLGSADESGSTLAERYLILGDWPSGNENQLIRHFDEFQVNISTPNKPSNTLSETPVILEEESANNLSSSELIP